MRKTSKFRIFTVGIIAIIAMLFSVSVTAQNKAPNRQQDRPQRFIDIDTNEDGIITKNEYKRDDFKKYDKNKDGKLSMKEYRERNQSLMGNKRKNMKKAGKKGNKGQGQGMKKGQGSGQGQGMRKGQGSGKGRNW